MTGVIEPFPNIPPDHPLHITLLPTRTGSGHNHQLQTGFHGKCSDEGDLTWEFCADSNPIVLYLPIGESTLRYIIVNAPNFSRLELVRVKKSPFKRCNIANIVNIVNIVNISFERGEEQAGVSHCLPYQLNQYCHLSCIIH